MVFLTFSFFSKVNLPGFYIKLMNSLVHGFFKNLTLTDFNYTLKISFG